MTKKRERIDWVGLEPSEEDIATKSFKAYKSLNHIDRPSDIEDLKSLIFNEILQRRMQIKLGVFEKKKEFPDKYMIDTFNSIQGQILNLKQKLGLLEQKKDGNFLNYIELVLKKFRIWKEENLDGRKVTCCWCGKVLFLNIKTDKYDVIKHPMFKGKILYNEHAFKLLQEGKIDKLDVAKIIQGEDVRSTDFVDWILDKVQKPSDKKSE